MRAYIEDKYSNITFLNSAIGGKSAKWSNNNSDNLVKTQDLAFIMLGTNDRWDSASKEEFEDNLTSFVQKIKNVSSEVILMSAQPSLNDYTDGYPTYNMVMEDINNIVQKVAKIKNVYFISFYNEFLNFITTGNVALNYLLENNGSHPLDSGHLLMWQILQKKLMLNGDYKDWKDVSYQRFSNNQLEIEFDTDITEDSLSYGITLHEIGGTHPDVSLFPEATGGLLTTYKGVASETLYNYQEYNVRLSNSTYKRYWVGGSGWTDFAIIDNDNIRENYISLSVAITETETIDISTGGAVICMVELTLGAYGSGNTGGVNHKAMISGFSNGGGLMREDVIISASDNSDVTISLSNPSSGVIRVSITNNGTNNKTFIGDAKLFI